MTPSLLPILSISGFSSSSNLSPFWFQTPSLHEVSLVLQPLHSCQDPRAILVLQKGLQMFSNFRPNFTLEQPEHFRHHTRILPFASTTRCSSCPALCPKAHFLKGLSNYLAVHLKPRHVPGMFSFLLLFTHPHAFKYPTQVLTSLRCVLCFLPSLFFRTKPNVVFSFCSNSSLVFRFLGLDVTNAPPVQWTHDVSSTV